MGYKAEISWTRRDKEGQKVQIYAHHVGKQWRFYIRERRYDRWEPMEQPPLEDWVALLDGVRRRVGRRLLRPEEISRVEKTISELFPESNIG